MDRSARYHVVKLLTTPSFLLLSLSFMVLYLLLQAYILNYTLINQTLGGSYAFTYKATLLYYIFTGYLHSLPSYYLGLTMLTTFLVGLNLALAYLAYKKARSLGEMRVSLGGSSLLAVVSSGCPSCGITALSLLGPSTGAFSLFLHDLRLQMVILGILLISIIYNATRLSKAPSCSLPKTN